MNGADRPVRVLQVIDTLSMGGAETWLMEVLRRWSANGEVRIDFLLTSGNPGLFDEEARALGAGLHYNRYTRRRAAPFAAAFRRTLGEGRYDAIHDHQDVSAGWHFLMGGGQLPERRIVHAHNPSFGIRDTYGVTPSRRAVAAIGRRLIGRYATHITGTSRQILTEWGFDGPRFRHIPKAALHCGFDPGRFAGDVAAAKTSVCREFGWPEDSIILLGAGRMDESPDLGHAKNHKNTGFSVDVAIAAMQRDPRVRAIFAGKTSAALPALLARVEAAGLAGNFAFPDIRIDIERLMLGSDLLLFPSRGEGLGMVAVEAQAAGLPVVASTAVPRECAVVAALVEFLDVDIGPAAWANEALRLVRLPRDNAAANRAIAASDFAIETSTRYLTQLYRDGRLPGDPDGRGAP